MQGLQVGIALVLGMALAVVGQADDFVGRQALALHGFGLAIGIASACVFIDVVAQVHGGIQVALARGMRVRSEEHTSELQSPCNLVCRLLLEKKKKTSVRETTLSQPTTIRAATLPVITSPHCRRSHHSYPLSRTTSMSRHPPYHSTADYQRQH